MSAGTQHDLSTLAVDAWDAVVIGAGPAGAVAAHQLVSLGLRTLVVDSKRFPRYKVCGGCLNRRGIAALQQAGLGNILQANSATSVRSLHWIVGHQRVRFALPEMRVVDRAAFDGVLVEAAIRNGAIFCEGVQASVEPQACNGNRIVTLTRMDERVVIAARVAICADGLSRSSLKRLGEFSSQVAPHSRIGVGATLPTTGSLARDELTMIASRCGYVGLAQSPLNRLNVAAALDPRSVAASSVDGVIRKMLVDAAVVAPDAWRRVDWQGTPSLTSRPNRVAAERLFVIGDAGGYVEPFSGEGMATALESALAVAPLAVEAVQAWQPSLIAEWVAKHRQLVVDQQTTCRQLAWMLRHTWAAASAIGLCRAQPWIAQRFIAKVS